MAQSIADEIIRGVARPHLEDYLAQGNTINDVDEYGFTFLIEAAIAGNTAAMQLIMQHGADVNKQDMTGRTPLHWAVDNDNMAQTQLLLEAKANPNIANRAAQSPLVFPLLREQWQIKQLLYQHGAHLAFAQDFINTKLIGHRFEIPGTVDIVNSEGKFVELDYEGFFLEFSLEVIRQSITRFSSHFSFRKLRLAYVEISDIIHAYFQACHFIHYQDKRRRPSNFEQEIHSILKSPLLILPVAYQGHAITFVRCGPFWAKCDRGENALKEGSVNIYWMKNSAKFNTDFVLDLLYEKQTATFIHGTLNQELGLHHIGQIPLAHQKAGNCSWANVEAAMPTAYVLIQLFKLWRENQATAIKKSELEAIIQSGLYLYQEWVNWDKDRTLEECIQSFYEADKLRQASKLAVLGGILFHGCTYPEIKDMERASKILTILTLPDYHYILQSYIDVYCEKRLTKRGNNLLHIIDDYGTGISHHVQPVAKLLEKRL